MRLRLPVLTLLLSACSPPAEEVSTAPPGQEPVTAPLAEEAASTPPAAAPSAVPLAFRGKWASSPDECNVPSESSLSIYEGRVAFYESSGLILSVASLGERELEMELELTGEGQTWRSARRFTISEDGRTLTDVTDGSSYARIRCE